MSRKKNSFKKAIKHLKSTNIDEKFHVLNEIPTNSTLGLYTVVPGSSTISNTTTTTKTVPDFSTIDFTVGENPTNSSEARDTTGLFDETGNSKLVAPPGDNSYILGPMSSMWYAWGNFSTIGYIRESDRRMVNLATITGKLSNWDQTQLYSYGQLTLEQALWFYNIPKKDNAGNDPSNANYRAYYPGPPSNTPDAYGRYLCTITGVPKATTTETETETDTKAPMDLQGTDNFSAIMDRLRNMFSKFGDNWRDNTKGMGDKLKDNLKKVLDQGKNFVDDLFDANNAADFNAKLALSLGLSIISGKKIDIPLSDSAKNDLINNINPDALKDVLKINDSTPTTADEAINPSGNKSDKVLGGGWDAQGGVDFNFNEKTGELEIVSNKTLRTDSGGETTVKDMIGPNFEVDKLTDIPDADKKNVQDMSTKILSDISQKLGGPGLDPNIPNYSVQQQLDDISQQYDDNAITSAVTEIASDIITQGTQGTAQNIIALRAALKNLSIKSSTDSNAWKPFSQDSDIEKIGGAAGHVTSTTTVKFDDLPADIKEVILDKLENKNVKESISESRKIQILKNLKQPIVIPETKQKSYKVRVGRKNKECKTNFQGMDKLIGTVKPQQSFKPRDMWSHGWQEYNARSSQDKKNTVLEKIGDGKYAWDYMINQGTMMNAKNLEEFWGKNPDFYSYFFNGKKYRPIRKEQVKGDFIVFLIDEFGNKSSMLQSELNLKLVEDYEKKMLAEYNELYDIESTYKKDPLFKRVSNRLSKEIDYPDKPSKKGYPDKPPLEVDPNTGMHPRYGKLSDRYKKLDPMSANAMPPTGEPEIDSVVDKQRTQSKNHLDFTKIKSLRKKG